MRFQSRCEARCRYLKCVNDSWASSFDRRTREVAEFLVPKIAMIRSSFCSRDEPSARVTIFRSLSIEARLQCHAGNGDSAWWSDRHLACDITRAERVASRHTSPNFVPVLHEVCVEEMKPTRVGRCIGLRDFTRLLRCGFPKISELLSGKVQASNWGHLFESFGSARRRATWTATVATLFPQLSQFPRTAFSVGDKRVHPRGRRLSLRQRSVRLAVDTSQLCIVLH